MHFIVFPVRSVDPILMLVLPILNFMFLVSAGTLTIVGTKPELSINKKKYRYRLHGLLSCKIRVTLMRFQLIVPCDTGSVMLRVA